MKRTPQAGSQAIDRRQLMSALGAGTGSLAALALGAAGFRAAPLLAQSIQIDSTPPAPPVPAPPPTSGETVEDVAARLNYDAEAIFAFVRDEVHYESYAGVLRGAKGTLWARAGNAADQAVLLAAILAAAQIPCRFATGALGARHGDTLSALLTPSADVARGYYEKVLVSVVAAEVGPEPAPATPPALSNDDQAALDRLEQLGGETLGLAARSLDVSRSAIGDALAAARLDLPPLPVAALTDFETSRHAWVQVADGPDWVDLDPSVPDLSAGEAGGMLAETFDAIPEDWNHRVSVRLVAEDNTGGSLTRRDVVTHTATSEEALVAPIAVSMAPAEGLGGLGLGIDQLFTSQKTVFPTIYADGLTIDAVAPMMFATAGASSVGVFDTGEPIVGAAEGETVAAWLVLKVTTPEAPPVIVERALLDRVPAEDRASGAFRPEAVVPIQTDANALGEDALVEFNTLTIIQVDVARMSARHALEAAAVDEVFGELRVFGPGLAALRDGLGLEHETRSGFWSYPSGPNVTAFSFTAGPADGAQATGAFAADLLHRERASWPLADVEADPKVHPLVLSGILDAVAEQALLAPESRGDDPATTGLAPSIGAIFEAAEAADTGVRVATTAADLAGIEADAAAIALMTRAVDAGLVVVVPEQPVDLAGVPFTGWWMVDPATGRTTDQLQNGRSYAASTVQTQRRLYRAQDTQAFYARWIAWMAENKKAFSCAGNVLGLIALIVGVIVTPTMSAAAAGLATVAGGGQLLRTIGGCV